MNRGNQLTGQQLFALVYSLKGKSLRASWDQRKHISIDVPLEKDTVPRAVTESIGTMLLKATHDYLGEEAVSLMNQSAFRPMNRKPCRLYKTHWIVWNRSGRSKAMVSFGRSSRIISD